MDIAAIGWDIMLTDKKQGSETVVFSTNDKIVYIFAGFTVILLDTSKKLKSIYWSDFIIPKNCVFRNVMTSYRDGI